MSTINCKDEFIEFYHGSCTLGLNGNLLLPPEITEIISEKGRKKNLNKVFFTTNKSYAKVYARRAVNSIGGQPTLFRVICPVNIQQLNETNGCDVYYADWAFVEQIDFGKWSD